MDIVDSEKCSEELLDRAQSIRLQKNQNYAERGSATANFRRNAERLGMQPTQIWAVYFSKHTDAVCNAIRDNPDAPWEVAGEPLKERLADIINYCLLLYTLFEEENLRIEAGISKSPDCVYGFTYKP